MTKKYWIIILLCTMVVLAGCKNKTNESGTQKKFAIDRPYYKGPLRVQLKLQSDTMPLSGLILLEIATEIDPEYKVHFPELNEVLKQFKIRNVKDLPERLGDNNKILKIKQYQLEPLEVGRCEIPPLTFTFDVKNAENKQEDQAESSVTTESLWVEVTTSLPADLQDITIEDIEGVVEVKTQYHWIGFALLLPLILILIIVIILITRRKKQDVVITRRIYKSAHEIALEMLKAIAAEKLVEHGQIKPFYEKLSGCLRQYIENRFKLRAPEQTTEEFLDHLKKSDALKLEYKQDLQRFLEHCDLVKFARYEPTHEQINESLTLAEQFIEKTKSRESLVDVTDQQQDRKAGG